LQQYLPIEEKIMQGVWIYKKDEETYKNLMTMECGGPQILQEKDDKVQVNFCATAMQEWVAVGFWYGFE
jgi:hypothetical protein